MRLLEAEVRTDSMTGTASGAKWTTHASSFSRCSRSRTFPLITTASIPNCLKQSTSKARAGSLISTKATLAEDFLLRGGGARTIPDDFCIVFRGILQLHCGLHSAPWQRRKWPLSGYQGLITGMHRSPPILARKTKILLHLGP